MAIKTIRFIAASSKSTLNEIKQPRGVYTANKIDHGRRRSVNDMVIFIKYIKIKKSRASARRITKETLVHSSDKGACHFHFLRRKKGLLGVILYISL